jgi:heme/copper-type cytochrome/quinol oxidase subunit 3
MQTTAPRSMETRARAGTDRLMLLLVLAAETVFFGTLVMVYLYLRAGADQPPLADRSGENLALPVINTAILLLSAGTAWWGVRAIRRGSRSGLTTSLLITLLLGLLFVAGQVAEFSRSGMQPDDAEFGGVFFTLMGFHALHVLAGVIVLIANLIRARLGDFDARHHLAVELGQWFWAYVTGVWLVLFAALYVL